MQSGPREAFTVHDQAQYITRCIAIYHALSQKALEYFKTFQLHQGDQQDKNKVLIIDCFKAVILNGAISWTQFEKAMDRYAKELYWNPVLKRDTLLQNHVKTDILDRLFEEQKVFVPAPSSTVDSSVCSCLICTSIQHAEENWMAYVPTTAVETYCKGLIDEEQENPETTTDNEITEETDSNP